MGAASFYCLFPTYADNCMFLLRIRLVTRFDCRQFVSLDRFRAR
jgi:hypothetical protein